MRFELDKIDTIVIKIGTSLLSGRLAFEGQVMEAVVKEICALKKAQDINILIVTSGAVGCGMNTLGMTERPTALPERQAVAAVGQATLMHYYETLFRAYGDGLHTAQVLLTLNDLNDRRTYLNARNTLQALLQRKTIIPIINENDSTAIEELRFGDNDTLAARIAVKTNANLLIILSDVDGLYDADPRKNENAALVREVHEITDELVTGAGGAGSITGTGGMVTKIEAARIGMAAGVHVVLANGHRKKIIHDTLSGDAPGTVFIPSESAISHRKRWIAFGRAPHGVITVDAGAVAALKEQGKSLLPAGVAQVEGKFDVGEAVLIRTPDGQDIARALVNYASEDIRKIMGRRTGEIEAILGRKDFDEIVHRNNLVIL